MFPSVITGNKVNHTSNFDLTGTVMTTNLSRITRLLVAAGISLAASSSFAGLVLVSPASYGGAGLGTVNTVLTIQNTPSETGSVAYSAGGDVITGDAKTGNSQTQTQSLSDLGVTSAAALRVVFNAVEPSGDSINLTNLRLSIYSATGATLFTSGAFTSQTFGQTFTGTGNAGYVFALDSADAALAQSSGFSSGFGTNRVGLAASATDAAGGNETFFVANNTVVTMGGGGGSTNLPEPASLALLGLGLGLIASTRKKKSA